MLFVMRDGKIAIVKEYADTAHARDVFSDVYRT
jgi:ketosteroid isomerase-like protein